MTINRKLRGIRDPVDPGYILGRPKNMGKGPAVQLKAPPGLLTPQQNVDVLGGLPASGVTAGSYTNANITVNAKGIVTLAGNGSGSLPALNDGQIWIGNGTNVAVARTPAGDVTISDTGVTAIGANKVLTAMIADGNVTEAKIGLSDNTTNNATASAHGFLKKLDGNATHYMGGDGNWTVPAGNGSTPGFVKLDSKSLSGVSTVSFTSFSNSYTDLVLVVRGRSNAATSAVGINVTFNNDTGSNYDYEDLENNGNGGAGQASSVGVRNTTSMRLGFLPAASGASSDFGGITVDIWNYNDTTSHKPVGGFNTVRNGTAAVTNNFTITVGGWWHNSTPAAVTRVDVTLASGNGTSGSSASLYGRL